MVVEDNPTNMKLINVMLQKAGYAVHQACDAETGIEMAKQKRPDLIFMDIQLPGMDGLEATRRLKADPVTKGVPVVALTAQAMAGDKEETLAAGCDGYLPKPVRYTELAALLASFFGADHE